MSLWHCAETTVRCVATNKLLSVFMKLTRAFFARAGLSGSDVSLWRKGEAYTLSSTSSNAWSIVPNSYLSRTASECGEEGEEETYPCFKEDAVLVALRGSNCALCRDEQTPLCLYEAHSGIFCTRLFVRLGCLIVA